eukprot:3743197-Pyramimonas_sp.AAC.1
MASRLFSFSHSASTFLRLSSFSMGVPPTCVLRRVAASTILGSSSSSLYSSSSCLTRSSSVT